VWESYLEWSAELFGVAVRSKLGQLVGYCLGLLALGFVLSLRWGAGGWVLPGLLGLLSVSAARQVAAARDGVWRAACAALDEPRQRPSDEIRGFAFAPTTMTLFQLAVAVDAVRRGRYVAANELVPQIQRDLLRPEEGRLLDAVRAMISMGLGSTERAAQLAVAALPTGSEELDTCLGRTLVADAWRDPARLAAIQRAWDQAGLQGGPLARLRTLVRIRLDATELDTLEAPAVRALSDEARAVGDDELASELDARSRPMAYR